MNMNHKEIPKKVLLYIDNDLPKPEIENMREHINSCSDCRERLKGFEKIWKLEGEKKLEPSPYIWTKLEAEIKGYEQNPVLFGIFYVKRKFAYILQPVTAAVLLFISVFTGYFGGAFLSKGINGNQDISNTEQIAKAFYLDKLEPQEEYFNE
ncbi:MAG: zf-HC2 domain-containing protein [bacterium]